MTHEQALLAAQDAWLDDTLSKTDDMAAPVRAYLLAFGVRDLAALVKAAKGAADLLENMTPYNDGLPDEIRAAFI